MGLGFNEAQTKAPSADDAEKVSLDVYSVQLPLAMLSYRDSHGEDEVNILDPRANTPEIKQAAMAAWLATDKGAALSARYRAYADTHPAETIDLQNETALADLLDRILKE